MSTPDSQNVAGRAGGSIRLSGVSNPGRGYVLTGANGISATGTTPTAGGEIDGVSCEFSGGRMFGIPATPGMPVQVRAGGLVSDGDDLQVQGDGDFVTASGGTVVARALEGASSGSYFWAVFT